MNSIPPFSEEDIRDLVGDQSYQRGQGYFRSKTIFYARRQGMTLKALCQGSDVYDVYVIFNTESIAETECSCPIGSYCKHVVALLLTWLAQPEEFVEQEDIDTALARLSQAELIALVKKLLRSEPNLESLLPLINKQQQEQQDTITPEMYRRKVETVFRSGGNNWRAPATIAKALLEIADTADDFAEQQNYDATVTIYESIVQGVFQHYEEYDDENGELASVLDECVTAMDNWLDNVKNDALLRERMLRLFFAIYAFDIEQGGVGIGENAPDLLLGHTRGDERQTVVGWIRDALSAKKGAEYHDKWRREHFGRLLLDLQKDSLDDETFLHTSREVGLTANVIERLLTLGQINEAFREAERADDDSITHIAELFVQHGQGFMGEALVQQHYKQSHNWMLREWLKQRYLAREEYDAILALAEDSFRQSPSLAGYQEMRQLAQRLNSWETLRPTLLSSLKQPFHANLLLQIALDEGDIDKALELVKARQTSGYGYSAITTVLQVAEVAEKSKPLAAIDIYQRQVEQLIAQRNRGSYHTACTYLVKIRSLYTQLHESETWTSYLTSLRDKYSSLRALRDEMVAAGVLA
ncbi:MAG: SWIM zinc finger family protein [Ktedonobacteraceae bacterium]